MTALYTSLMIALLVGNYLFISYGILFKQEKNNFVSWLLWTLLDIVAMYGIWRKGEDMLMIIVFAVGTGLIALLLGITRQWRFGPVEAFILVLVFASAAIAQVGDDQITIWASAFALFLAGVPYLDEIMRKRIATRNEKTIAFVFLLAMIFANLAALTAEKVTDTTILIPLSCLLYWVLALFFAVQGPKLQRSGSTST